MSKVIKIDRMGLEFDDGIVLSSNHEGDCCEEHYLDFSNLDISDFYGLEFNFEGDFFKKIPNYGIELIPVNGWSVKIAGYSYNNGYYSDNLSLQLIKGKPPFVWKAFDITECQENHF